MKDHYQSKFLAIFDEAKLPILGDGAMGTMLNSRRVGFNQFFDALNLTNPALVADIHRAYIEAGAQIIQTNTFGANRYKLAGHNLEDKVEEINRAGVELAHRVFLATFKEVLVTGDIGPLGVRLAPLDSEVIVHLIAHSKGNELYERVAHAISQINGSFSLIILREREMIAIRDPYGVRPLSLGMKDGAYVIASETCCL